VVKPTLRALSVLNGKTQRSVPRTRREGRDSRAVSQLLWPDKYGEVWFSLEENHEESHRSGLHQLRNRSSAWRSGRERCRKRAAD
jgi:predicted phage gp36 major capsid-like protein